MTKYTTHEKKVGFQTVLLAKQGNINEKKMYNENKEKKKQTIIHTDIVEIETASRAHSDT